MQRKVDPWPPHFPHQQWYLNAIASESSWHHVKVLDNQKQVLGILPFQIKSKWGIKLITPPPLCPRLGPLLFPPAEMNTPREQQDFSWKVLRELAQQLPPFAYARIRWPYNLFYGRPWQALGWEQTVRYSYVLDLKMEEEELWNGIRSYQRRNIRKGLKCLSIKDSVNTRDHWELYQKMVKIRPEVKISDRIRASFDELVRGDFSVKLFYAVDSREQAHASLMMVYDQQFAIYLLPYSDPALRQSGAAPLLLWHAIRWAKEAGLEYFDFEGSHLPGVEFFFRSFGATAWPYYEFEKGNKWIMAAKRLMKT
jgi:CelD/BcsL family acetyltransferase involved in cellulose biosynthesis